MDVRSGYPVDPALGEQRGVEDAARGDVPGALEVHAAHAEVTELVLVGDPGDLGAIAYAAMAQLELEVDDVLERGPLARAGPVTDADQKAALLPAPHPLDLLIERRRGLRCVLGQAHRQAVPAVGSEPLGLVEPQRRPGRVDQEVIPDLRPRSVRRLRDYIGGGIAVVALRVDLPRGGLHELDSRPLVHRRERERDLRRLHQTDPDPDVRRHPVVIGPRRHHRHRVVAPEPLARERRRGMARRFLLRARRPGSQRPTVKRYAHHTLHIGHKKPSGSSRTGE